MKLFLILLFFPMFSYAEENQSICIRLNQYLIDGNPDGLLNEANQRLAVNENDIAGLLLKMEYELLLMKLEDLNNTCDKILTVGENIESQEFKKVYPLLVKQINSIKSLIPNILVDNIDSERQKAYTSKPKLIMIPYLEACEKDGLLTE